MKIDMARLCRVFSHAFDTIEAEQLGATSNHSMRLAALCAAAGKRLGYDDDSLTALLVCALFHDNALTEFGLSEAEAALNAENMLRHCEKGQQNLSWLPFKKDISGLILYHHERGDGRGPFGKREGEFPFDAALISAADSIDIAHRLQQAERSALPALRDKIAARAENYSTRAAVDVLLEVLDEDMLESLRDDKINKALDRLQPAWEVDLREHSVVDIAGFIAHIIDYKSKFTRKHTTQIANRSWLMAKYYGYDLSERAALYLAASLHDIGKIATPIEILEKPGKLDRDEFQIIMAHVRNTHDWLSEIPGFEKIRDWAAGHHEKLSGTGYPFGKKADALDFNSRLIACLDIYQAVCEPRPYHGARSHEETMPILYGMAEKGFIDAGIVSDIDEVMGAYSNKDVPPPE